MSLLYVCLQGLMDHFLSLIQFGISRKAYRGESVGRLTSDQVWNGRPGIIEGLIRDWVRWQRAEESKSFSRFRNVLLRLSPQDLGQLTPDVPIRIPGDPRDIPTIRHNYGTVPIVHASSGVQRILQLAYLIIWCWQEHETGCIASIQAAPTKDACVCRRIGGTPPSKMATHGASFTYGRQSGAE